MKRIQTPTRRNPERVRTLAVPALALLAALGIVLLSPALAAQTRPGEPAKPGRAQDTPSKSDGIPDNATIDAAIDAARQRLAAARKEAADARTASNRERLALIQRLTQAHRTGRDLEARLAETRTRHESTRVEMRRLDTAIAASQRELKGLAATIRRGLDTLISAEKSALVTLEHPELLHTLSELRDRLETREDVTPEELATLHRTLERYLEEARGISRFRAPVVGQDGRVRPVDVCRLGQAAAFYLEGSRVGHLNLDDQGHWTEMDVAAGPSVRALFTDPDAAHRVPLDPSGGLALAADGVNGGLWDRIEAGGPVMIPLGLVVLAALALALERIAFLLRARQSLRRVGHVADLVRPGWNRDRVRAGLASRPGLAARILVTVLDHPDGGEAAVDHALCQETPALERSLGLLGVLGTVAPFLGLLGTVTGLISTFGTLTAVGSNDPRLLAGGISEALITTQAGLMVAIPILLVHAYLTNRVDDLTDRLESAADTLAAGTAAAATLASATPAAGRKTEAGG